MLKQIFNYLDHHPHAYWLMAATTVPVVVFWILDGLRRDRRPAPSRSIAIGWTVCTVLFCLLAWRWPYLLSATEYNPDESQFIAGAITLTHDPVFWRSVDGTTSGPLNFYALLPLHWAGLPLDYFSARLTSLLLIGVALVFSYASLRTRYDRTSARLGILPAIAFFSLVHEWDFVHYSSEYVSLALVAASVYFLLRSQAATRYSRLCLIAGGMIAGLLPWAKLQATPIAGVLVIWGCGLCLRASQPISARRRAVALLAGTAAAPTVLAMAALFASNQWGTFERGYLLQNFYYVAAARPLWESIGALIRASTETLLLPVFFFTEFILISWCLLMHLRRRTRPDALFMLGLLATITATVCVAVPRRGFLHYALFLTVPLLLWGSAAFAEIWRTMPVLPSRRRFAGVLTLLALIASCGLRINQGLPDMMGQFSDHWRHPRSAAGNIIHAFARPGDRLTVWGWLPRLYVESALPQGTRIGYSYLSMMPSPLRDYHRDEFMRDLRSNQPTFFVDAVGPESYYFLERAVYAHETFPELDEYIRKHYLLIADLGYARTYYRRDAFNPDRLPLDALPSLIAQGRPMGDGNGLPLQNLAQTHLPEKFIAGHAVRMMLPPAEAIWLLDGTESTFLFEYGYDPVAWHAGLGNGTEFQVFLDVPDQAPRLLFTKLLNPAHVLADRGPQTAQIPLPYLPPGARLRIQTGPGEFNDDSWDWAYIAQVRYRHEVFYTQRSEPVPDNSTHHATAGDNYNHRVRGSGGDQ